MDYFANLDRIEFEITPTCTGKCKHCSVGDRVGLRGHIDGELGARIVRRLCAEYKIDSLMTFGGEPLLYPETIFTIQSAAKESGIPKRHVITNGYFSKDSERIRDIAHRLAESGVTKVMLSVDSFHQETIPLEPVMLFARAVHETGVTINTHPAWLVSREDENPYNLRTRELLAQFVELDVTPSKGNVIFPEGNALRYLGEYFDADAVYVNPYAEDPCDIHTVSISADGSVLGGNVNLCDIDEIMNRYKPRLERNTL